MQQLARSVSKKAFCRYLLRSQRARFLPAIHDKGGIDKSAGIIFGSAATLTILSAFIAYEMGSLLNPTDAKAFSLFM